MEAVGFASALLAILEASGKIVLACYEYRQALKSATDDIARLLAEAISIRNVTERLIEIAGAETGVNLPTLQIMCKPGGLLDSFVSELEDLSRLLEPHRKRTVILVLKWPLTKSECEKSLSAMGRIKSTLQLALGADTAGNINAVLEHTRSLPKIGFGVSRLVEQTNEAKQDKALEDVLRLIRGRDEEQKYQEQAKRRANGTGEWLLSNESYIEWKARPCQLMWLHGMSGCGKTVLCSKVIQDLKYHCQVIESSSLCYYFFDGSDSSTVSLEKIHRSLISQLVCQIQASDNELDLEDLKWDLESLNAGPEIRQARTVTVTESLEAVLVKLMSQFGSIYVVIDGFDECEDADALENILKSLGRLLQKKMCSVHLFTSSRSLERLRFAFEDLKAILVPVGNEETDNDLQTALEEHLASHRKCSRWPVALKTNVKDTLLSRANGSFRWLDCQVQELKKCATPRAVRDTLEQLPGSLHIHYARVLSRIHEKDRVSVRNLLRWVTFACRPLSLEEICAAISINSEASEVPFVDDDLELFDIEDFLDSCSSLISIYHGPVDTFGASTRRVQLAHYSVKEFLVSDAFKETPRPEFGLHGESTEAHLAKSCLAYFLQTTEHDSEDFWEHNPLACYAGRFWLRHWEISHEKWELESYQRLSTTLFDASQPYFRTWIKVDTVDKPWAKKSEILHEEDEGENIPYTPLYCASWHGLGHVVQALLAQGNMPEGACGLYGNPLQAASRNGHLAVVKLLIDANVDVNASGGRYGSAVGAAAAQGHADIVCELLKAGATAQLRGRRFGDHRHNTLFLAVEGGSLEIVRQLLAHGAKDYWVMKARPASALDSATRHGRIDIVKELLQHRGCLKGNSMRSGCSALVRPSASGLAASQYSAARLGHKEILRELAVHEMSIGGKLRHAAKAGDLALVLECLDNGAEIDEPEDILDHPRALVSAASSANIAIVRELLSRGADPNPNALEAAANAGSLEIVQELVKAGADVNPKWSRPVHAAVRGNQWEMLAYLAGQGADLHLSLHEATVSGDFQAFEQLVKLGADINREEPGDEAPLLQAAARGGNIRILECLLESGMVLNPPDASCTTPLMEAIRSKNWKAMRLLLDRGANVNAVPPSDPGPPLSIYVISKDLTWPPKTALESPLTLAARAGSEEACFDLIERGASITSSYPVTSGTPLVYAIWEGLTEVIHALLGLGANPNQHGTIVDRDKPSTPLLLAIEKRDIDTVHRLIAAGADVDEQDIEGFSPLHVAAVAASDKDATEDIKGDAQILETLITKYHASINSPRLLNGSLPLHSAASRGSISQVRFLIDAGAEIDAINNDGRTPLHWAAENGRWDVVELLLDRKANHQLRSREETLQMAWQLGHAAKEQPLWRIRPIKGWDTKRVDALLERLESATKDQRETH